MEELCPDTRQTNVATVVRYVRLHLQYQLWFAYQAPIYGTIQNDFYCLHPHDASQNTSRSPYIYTAGGHVWYPNE